ncbi:MAG: large subunit ribosomal protein L37Ae [bacterium]|nr:MAG: large subunit ribosomal protein L37Ae [bacterium]
MGAKTKKIKAAGKFSGGIGVKARKEFNTIEAKQRKRQMSPFYPKARAIRIAAGIWKCLKTGKIFSGHAYYLENRE